MNLAHTLSTTRIRPNAAAIIDTSRRPQPDHDFRRTRSGRRPRRPPAGQSRPATRRRRARLSSHVGGIVCRAAGTLSPAVWWRCSSIPSAGREHIERCCAMHPPRGSHRRHQGPPAAPVVPAPAPHPRQVRDRLAGAVRRPLVGRGPTGTVGGSSRLASADTPALLTFTSGSTGQPKAAVRSHGFLLAQYRALAAAST